MFQLTQTLILASKSPRRKEILEQLNLPFQIMTSDFVEQALPHPIDHVLFNAEGKALDIVPKVSDGIILACDTIVSFQDKIFEKPKTMAEAHEFLTILAGKTHQVISGFIILDVTSKKIIKDYESTDVTFYPLTSAEIKHYLPLMEPLDKAGGYAIQGYGGCIVQKIKGDYYNVVGLPVGKIMKKLDQIGLFIWN